MTLSALALTTARDGGHVSAAARTGENRYLMGSRRNAARDFAADGVKRGTQASRFLARKECLEGGDRLLGAHPFAEQMTLLIDPASQVLRRQFQKFSRNR